MYGRQSYSTRSFGIGGFSRPPQDLIVLLAVVFVTYSFQFFASTAWITGLLHLSPAVWRAGFVWQVVTYAFAGFGPASVWFLLELLILYWFGSDVYWQLGRRGFWRLVLAGEKYWVATKPLSRTSMPAASANLSMPLGGLAPTARTTMSKDSTCNSPFSGR